MFATDDDWHLVPNPSEPSLYPSFVVPEEHFYFCLDWVEAGCDFTAEDAADEDSRPMHNLACRSGIARPSLLPHMHAQAHSQR
jgi:hypothetical protein